MRAPLVAPRRRRGWLEILAPAVSWALLAVACGPAKTESPAAMPLSRVMGEASGATSANASVRLPEEPVPLGPLPTDTRPTRELLRLNIDPETPRFSGTATIDVTLDRPRDVLFLHGRQLNVSSCDLVLPNGEHVGAAWSVVDPSGVAKVSLGRAVAGNATLTCTFDAPYDASLVGVYRTAVGASHAVFSKFEAIYARRAFPCFDEPWFKVPFDVTLTVPKDAVALSNMPVSSISNLGDSKVVTFATTPPLPTYLVAFAVGPFESRKTDLAASAKRAKTLPLGAVALRGREADTAFAMAESPAILTSEEAYYELSFPFPKLDLLAVPDFQSGAMENAGLITFRDSALLVDEKSATLGQRISVMEVAAHEIAHQWFGDLVTMRWWDDLWLNESFASFLATKTMHRVKPELELELREVESADNVMSADGLASTRRIRQPITSTDDITNAFDGITYAKGEALLTMVEHFIGEEPFRVGLHDYLSAHAWGNATTQDLVGALTKASGRDLGPLFTSFLEQPGVPLIFARPSCENGKGAVALEQSRALPYGSSLAKDALWTVPVCVKAGIAGKVVESCALLDSQRGTLALPGCAAWIMPNAGAAGYYRFALEPAELTRLRDRGTKSLTTAERMALAENLDAAFHSGSVAAGDLLRAIAPLARDPHGAVAVSPLPFYRAVNQDLLDAKWRAKFDKYVQSIYAPTVTSLGYRADGNESTWRALERTELLTFLAMRMDDPAVLAELARLGRSSLGLPHGGPPTAMEVATHFAPHAEAISPDLVGLALSATVRLGDARAFDTVLSALVASNDAPKRRAYLVALASTRDPALAARALDLSLDPRLRKNERLTTLSTLLSDVATRDLAWRWLVLHFDALAPMLPDRFGGNLPRAVRFCDAAKADEVQAFFAPRVPSLTGGARNLAQSVEAMKSCAALAAKQRESAMSFVAQLP